MTEPEDSRPPGLILHPDEARRRCFSIVRVLGELFYLAREDAADVPELARVDPLYSAIAKSLDNARGDAEADVEKFVGAVCEVLGHVFDGIVAIEDIDGEARAEFNRRFGDL